MLTLKANETKKFVDNIVKDFLKTKKQTCSILLWSCPGVGNI
jgi:hypothetical protein